MAIDLTDGTSPARANAAGSAPGRAALAALKAPSIFNSQPWRWRLHDGVAELWLERERQLKSVDPEGRLATLSCGIALHHAGTALRALGYLPRIDRFPDPAHADLLAVLGEGAAHRPTPRDLRDAQTLRVRRTDRRPYDSERAIPAGQLATVRDAAESCGGHLHVLRDEQVPVLTVAASRAAQDELSDPAYRDELNVWTHRPAASGDGVPTDTAVRAVPRRVPVRDFAPAEPGLPAGEGTDRHATYAILFTDRDDQHGWLTAGEALSAGLLQATMLGISANPISDVIEVPAARHILSTMLLSGIGFPMLALRMGFHEATSGVPDTPRRDPEDVVETIDRPPR
ncbi:MAG: nitroreductase [Actinocatenispora sp.]